ncbi:NAD+ synthase [Thermodesulfobacteriota bacterium]
MKRLRICNSQLNCCVGDLSGNSEKIIRDINIARENEADIVIFPELAICGYPPEDLLFKPSFISENLSKLEEIVKETANITTVVGFVERDTTIFNAAAIISNGEIKGIYRKALLPNYGVFDENRYFSKGDTKELTFSQNGVIFAVNICEDIWYGKGEPIAQAIKANAELIINISASPFYSKKRSVREHMLKTRAKENGVMISYNNLVGGQDELVFDGGSMVIDRDGHVISCAKRFHEDIIFSDLKFEDVTDKDTDFDVKDPIQISSDAGADTKSAIDERLCNSMKDIEEIYEALCLGIKDYVRKNGFKKVVIGLSGGIDSALTAALAVLALGSESVIGVTMPSEYTSHETKSDAELLANNLDIRLITLPINDIYEKYLDELSDVFEGEAAGVAEENIQARVRGNLLMALSNKFGWLVLSTGNKSEVSVGYCTLYGDMAGGFSALKDVYKRLVYKLSEYINEREDREVIPVTTIEREPSAELSPDQKDSDTLPPYDILDEILEKYIEQDLSLEEIVNSGFEEALTKRIIRMRASPFPDQDLS